MRYEFCLNVYSHYPYNGLRSQVVRGLMCVSMEGKHNLNKKAKWGEGDGDLDCTS